MSHERAVCVCGVHACGRRVWSMAKHCPRPATWRLCHWSRRSSPIFNAIPTRPVIKLDRRSLTRFIPRVVFFFSSLYCLYKREPVAQILQISFFRHSGSILDGKHFCNFFAPLYLFCLNNLMRCLSSTVRAINCCQCKSIITSDVHAVRYAQ